MDFGKGIRDWLWKVLKSEDDFQLIFGKCVVFRFLGLFLISSELDDFMVGNLWFLFLLGFLRKSLF